jgi:hypothetical protein
MSEDPYTYPKEVVEAAEQFEKQYGLPHGFVIGLPKEDDWSFIVKIHALIEAAVTTQLSESIDPRLTLVFEQLELSDPRKGKIAFTKALNTLDSNQRRFIRFLSELRNDLVHNVRNVSFNITAHLSTLDKKQRANFIDAITYFVTNAEFDRSQAAKNPKTIIWVAALLILVHTSFQANADKRERESLHNKAKMLDRVVDAYIASQK